MPINETHVFSLISVFPPPPTEYTLDLGNYVLIYISQLLRFYVFIFLRRFLQLRYFSRQLSYIPYFRYFPYFRYVFLVRRRRP